MASCAVEGGCPSDYIAVAFSIVSLILLLYRSMLPFVIHKSSHKRGSGFWIPVIQVFASFNLILSIVMSVNMLKFKRRHWWQSCYIWAVWIEGPVGLGLLLSCRIIQAYQLYFIFGKRHLPPLRSHVSLPLFLLPWFTAAALIHMKKPLNYHCHMRPQWVIPVMSFHMLYVAILIAFTGAVRQIEFRFNELRDLWRGIVVSASSIGVWIAAYVLNEVHEEIAWLQVASRFLLLVMSSILVIAFFSISSSQPLLTQISIRKREPLKFETMGQALGIPESGLLAQREPSLVVDSSEPLDKLLLNRGFRQSFMAFADRSSSFSYSFFSKKSAMVCLYSFLFSLQYIQVSCLAGESVHFYDDVHELGKIPANDSVRRIYMARDIIHKYIIAGAPMEVNISHRCRQDILTTSDLAHPHLFNNALNELLQLMKMNLAKDYWSSMYFLKFKEEASTESNSREMDQMTGWNFSPRLSAVRSTDDPFHQEHLGKGFDHGNSDNTEQP